MSNRILSTLLSGATVFNVTLLVSTSAKAEYRIEQRSQQTGKVSSPIISEFSDDIGQVTNVNQLRDVSPTDWAYQALQSLVERYGCIAGFSNQTYRGTSPLSRYEFAAGLNSCLNQIERLIASGETVVQEDAEILQKLRQEFDVELSNIASRVDNLEGRTAFLEDNQFSTTTKLTGEIFNYLLGTFGDEKPNGEEVDEQITFSSRVRLFFDSSFTGQDRLRVRLQARNIVSPAESGGNNALALNFEGNNDNDVELSQLYYTFPVNDTINAFIGTTGIDIDDIFDAYSTMGLAYDSLSLFSAYNNLLYDNGNAGGSAIGANLNFEWATLDVGYWATNPASSEEGNGLFNGNYTTGANLNFSLFEERWNIAVAYLRAYQDEGSGYDLAGFVGTDAATDPFSNRSNSSNNYSIASKFDITDSISLGGYFGYSTASVEESEADADILTWNTYLYFTDLFQERDVILLSFGQPPTLVDSEGDAIVDDEDNPYIINFEYRFDLTDNINIAPGGYVLFNPNGDSNNDTIYVGTIRTLLSF